MLQQPNLRTPRKPMRKGTHSCYECRKRKVRCIFAKDSTICGNCDVRGRKCTEQRRELVRTAALDTRESLRDKVARLEAVIQASGILGDGSTPSQISNHLVVGPINEQSDELRPESCPTSISGNPTPFFTASLLESSASIEKSSAQDIDPIVTLFDNAIWRSRSSDWMPSQLSKINKTEHSEASKKRIRTRKSLLVNLISPELRCLVVNATCSWWHTWRPLGSRLPASIASKKRSSLPDFLSWAFESYDPSIIGIAILCVAVCLQQLDTRVHQYIIRQLPSLPGTLFQEYFEKVEKLIISDSDYAGTEEGIEVIVFAAKIYMNLGLNKKSWILTHQAISYSQLLNLHRPDHPSIDKTPIEKASRIGSWLSLCAGDVYLSLLLGLPYAADGRTIPLTHNQNNPTLLFHHKLILLSVKVIDRNQHGLSLTLPVTSEIQTELELAIKELDPSFWDAPTALAEDRITRAEYLEQIACQCWYYQLLVLLHMPLMIHAISDFSLEPHRVACLAASRSLLRVYHIMRSDSFAAFGMLKLIDYQAFVCSALLILGMLGYGACENKGPKDDQSRDRELIGLTIMLLRQAGSMGGNPIAKQAVQGLETLMSLGQGDCPRSKERGSMSASVNVNPVAKIAVPYVGVITISPGEYYANLDTLPKPSAAESHPSLAFSLSHDAHREAPGGSSNNPSRPVQTGPGFGELEGEEARGEFVENVPVQPEYTSIDIDFDWASTITTAFEDDWAWLNGMSC